MNSLHIIFIFTLRSHSGSGLPRRRAGIDACMISDTTQQLSVYYFPYIRLLSKFSIQTIGKNANLGAGTLSARCPNRYCSGRL